MKSDINLISIDKAELVKEGKTVQLLKISAIASVVTIGVSSLILFIILQAISPRSIKKQEASIQESISAQQAKEAKIVIVGRKIKDIRNIINKRPQYELILSEISSSIPQNISITSLIVDDKKVQIAVSSNSLLALNDLLSNLFKMVENGKVIANLQIEGISSDNRDGSYTMSVSGDRI